VPLWSRSVATRAAPRAPQAPPPVPGRSSILIRVEQAHGQTLSGNARPSAVSEPVWAAALPSTGQRRAGGRRGAEKSQPLGHIGGIRRDWHGSRLQHRTPGFSCACSSGWGTRAPASCQARFFTGVPMTTDTSPARRDMGNGSCWPTRGVPDVSSATPRRTRSASWLASCIRKRASAPARPARTGRDGPSRARPAPASSRARIRMTSSGSPSRASWGLSRGFGTGPPLCAARPHRVQSLPRRIAGPPGEVSRHSLVSSQALDLTELEGRELEERVTSVLAGPGH
jgi:hypothetical protein